MGERVFTFTQNKRKTVTQFNVLIAFGGRESDGREFVDGMSFREKRYIKKKKKRKCDREHVSRLARANN